MDKRTAWTRQLGAEARDELRRLGEHLRAARERRGLSAAELARRIGVDRRTLARLEDGDPTVSVGVLLQALDVLNLARGFAEVVAPENDVEAALEAVRRIRRGKRRAPHIGDDEVDF
jgi:transcriptional regulator with XRE-family HTH domain